MEDVNQFLTSAQLTQRDMLTYYSNVWTRYASAATVDLVVDEALTAVNPDMLVLMPDGAPGDMMKVSLRVLKRRESVAEALRYVDAIDGLLSKSDVDLAAGWDALRGLVAAAPKKYVVKKQFGLAGKPPFQVGQVLLLDPSSEQVEGLVADGTVAPAEETTAKAAPETPAA